MVTLQRTVVAWEWHATHFFLLVALRTITYMILYLILIIKLEVLTLDLAPVLPNSFFFFLVNPETGFLILSL